MQSKTTSTSETALKTHPVMDEIIKHKDSDQPVRYVLKIDTRVNHVLDCQSFLNRPLSSSSEPNPKISDWSSIKNIHPQDIPPLNFYPIGSSYLVSRDTHPEVIVHALTTTKLVLGGFTLIRVPQDLSSKYLEALKFLDNKYAH